MDPRDRLWHDLVFVRCDPSALLALRAVCRAFRAQLRDSRLWLPLTLELPRMRYDEQLAGWAGVERAIRREHVTRTNCDAGRVTLGPVLDVQDAQEVMFVGGRIAAFGLLESVTLCDAITGVCVATFAVSDEHFMAKYATVVLDRWIVFPTRDDRLLLLDCVAVQLIELERDHSDTLFCIAGPYVSFEKGLDVTVKHISGGSDGVTVVREVMRVRMASAYNQFSLCERGRSYLLRNAADGAMQLYDVATGRLKRVYTPRALLLCGWAMCECSWVTNASQLRRCVLWTAASMTTAILFLHFVVSMSIVTTRTTM